MRMMEGVRLNKYISDSGFCSRRAADEFIAQGRVTVNGKDTMEVCLVVPGDKILVDGEAIRIKKRAVYIALNKPVGVTCTVDPEDKTNIADFVGYKERIYPIGRLDKPSQGLIFLTNDGDIVNKILRAGNAHQKEYVVNVHKPLTDLFLAKMAAGVRIDKDTRTLPCKVSKMGESQFRVTLTQGLNRQIRRMCESLGYNVTKLNRTRIMNITLKGLDLGQWRFLTPEEVEQLMAMTEHSTKTDSPDQEPTRSLKAGRSTDKRSDKKSDNKPTGRSTRQSGSRTNDRTSDRTGERNGDKSKSPDKYNKKQGPGSRGGAKSSAGAKTGAKSGAGIGGGSKSTTKSTARPTTKSTAKPSSPRATAPKAKSATERPERKAAPSRKPKTAYENYRSKGRTR